MVRMTKTVKSRKTVQHVPRGQTHPYLAWKSTALWRAVEKAVSDLVENRDLVEDEYREYIVGYICKTIDRRRKAVIAQLRGHSHSWLL